MDWLVNGTGHVKELDIYSMNFMNGTCINDSPINWDFVIEREKVNGKRDYDLRGTVIGIFSINKRDVNEITVVLQKLFSIIPTIGN